jgi:hypothetical protein
MIIKYSVVIPTLWKSSRIHILLKSLIECEYVDEIILIDNSREFKNYYDTLKKVRVVSPLVNVYVNPAWNYGVKFSKNNFIALINDDITFDTKIFGKLSEDSLKECGFIGMHDKNYEISKNDETNWIFENWHPTMYPHGWGCFILFHKDNWIPIPNEIKIWFGDNFIREVNPAKKMILKGFKIETEMSTTSADTSWNPIKKEDTKYYISKIKRK